MKHSVFALLLLCLFVTACTKDKVADGSGDMMGGVTDSVPTAAMLKYSGRFSDGPYGYTSGVVKIYEDAGKLKLVLDSFLVNNGPDLHVYLSKEVQPVTFIDLGKLKATSGRQVYDINNMPDFSSFKYALIHCQQFNHLFGSAAIR